MERYKLKILGLSEIRWTGAGEHRCANDLTLLYSGMEEDGSPRRDGVGVLLSKDAAKSVLHWRPVSQRIIYVRFKTRARNISLYQCYAPTEDSEAVAKESFFLQLSNHMSSIPRGDIVLLMGDFNAKIGPANNGIEHICGKHGQANNTNENGSMLIDLCNTHSLVIGGTLFPHKSCHKVTWVSPDSRTQNQIDHIAISRRWRRSLLDVRNRRGADIGSDHHLLIGCIRLKIASVSSRASNQLQYKKYNLDRLNDQQCKSEYLNKLSQFQLADREHLSLEEKWDEIQGVIHNAADTLGRLRANRQPWMSDQTWEKINERKALKARVNSATDANSRALYQQQYSLQNKEVRRSVRKDLRSNVNRIAEEAENAAATGNQRKLYSLTRELINKKPRGNLPLKSADGSLLTSAEEQLGRWRSHFMTLLNRTLPTYDSSPPNNTRTESTSPTHHTRINTSAPSKREIISAIKSLPNGKAPGTDGIPVELLKADPRISADLLYEIIKEAWDTNTFPRKFKEGILIKLPKKGDLRQCDNWRGICLLPAVTKIISKVILDRIKGAIERKLRKEQAGFRTGHSCIDHINTLRIILEQSTEFQSPLHLAFVDFEKAFDSVDRSKIWTSLLKRGIPGKIVEVIQALYEGSTCRVLHQGKLSDPFEISSGVKQGCILSPTLFLIVINDVLAAALDRAGNRGIQWGLGQYLRDLDYADDICLLSHRGIELDRMMQSLRSESAKAGLMVNVNKTKIMRLNASNTADVLLGDREIEEVEKFCYLGSIVTGDGGTEEDVKARINKARAAFSSLAPVWRNGKFSANTKIRIFNASVKSVLLYGCETWKVTQAVTHALQVFINWCTRRILRVRWSDYVPNEELWRRSRQQPVDIQIRRRKWQWIGHTLRKDNTSIARQSFDWNPQGHRRPGRPVTTWRRTVMAEARRLNRSWNELKVDARNRVRWRLHVEALCPTRDERS